MLKILRRLLALSVALAITLSLGIVVSAEFTYSLAADGVMTTVPLTKDNEGNATASATVTYNGDGSVTFTGGKASASYKLPAAYSEGTTIYVHVTGTNSGSNTERAYLINNSDNCISDILYMPSGTFDVWEEITVNDGKTAKEIIFKGKDGGTNIVDLTITSLEIYVGTATEYCARVGHSYDSTGKCTKCGAVKDSCVDLLDNLTLGHYNGVATNSNGAMIANDGVSWITVKLDQNYNVGDTVKLHISGTSENDTVRFYLSQSDQSGRITADDTLTVTDGVFDGDVEFTVMDSSTDSKYTGTQAIYLNIKPKSGVSSFTSLTITHLGVVQTEYSITVDDECENGTIEADKETAAAGTTVTLTADPDDGYEFSEWKVTYGDNNEAVTVADDGTFTMPAGNVTVSATFVEKAAPEEGDLLFDGNITVSSSGSATLANGTLTVADGTEWIAVKLDQSYAIGETVTIHIAGSSSTKLRWYLSESNSGSGNITTPAYFFDDSNGNFDVTRSFTVEEGLTGTAANYLFIKAPSGSKLSGLTITTLEVVANPAAGGGSLVPTSSVDGVIYVNEDYHGYLVTENGRTHILSAPHNVDANGYCTVCHGYIGTTEEEEEVTVDITEEEVEIIDAQEPGDTDDEDSADSEGEPETTVETNPTTGAMLALIPIAIASLAAISSKKK